MLHFQLREIAQPFKQVIHRFGHTGHLGRHRATQTNPARRSGGGWLAGFRRCNVHFPCRKLVQAFANIRDFARIGFRPALVMRQLRAQNVTGSQERIHHFRSEREFLLAQAVEQ